MLLDKTHLVGFGLAIVLSLGLVYSIEARIADKADARATIAETKAALALQQNTAFQASVTAQIAQLQAQNASLAKALAQRATVERNTPPQNGSLSATQVAQGIQTATNAKPGEVSVQGEVPAFSVLSVSPKEY